VDRVVLVVIVVMEELVAVVELQEMLEILLEAEEVVEVVAVVRRLSQAFQELLFVILEMQVGKAILMEEHLLELVEIEEIVFLQEM
jgi:hypothetical protein